MPPLETGFERLQENELDSVTISEQKELEESDRSKVEMYTIFFHKSKVYKNLKLQILYNYHNFQLFLAKILRLIICIFNKKHYISDL